MELIRQLFSGLFFAVGMMLIIDVAFLESPRSHPAWQQILAAIGLIIVGLIIRFVKVGKSRRR